MKFARQSARDLRAQFKAMWDDSTQIFRINWPHLQHKLKDNWDLDAGDRELLSLLVTRMLGSKEARRKLGFEVSGARTVGRDEAVARLYVALRAKGEPPAKIEAEVFTRFPGLGASTYRNIVESRKRLATARMQNLNESMHKLLQPGPVVITIKGARLSPKKKRKKSGV